MNKTKEYKREYNVQHYRQLKADIKPIEFDFIDNLAKSLNISKASLIVKSIRYIYNNNVDIVNYNYCDEDKTE